MINLRATDTARRKPIANAARVPETRTRTDEGTAGRSSEEKYATAVPKNADRPSLNMTFCPPYNISVDDISFFSTHFTSVANNNDGDNNMVFEDAFSFDDDKYESSTATSALN